MTLRWQFDALQQGWFVRIAQGTRTGHEVFVPLAQAPVFLASVAAGINNVTPVVTASIMEQFDASPQSGSVPLQ